MKRICTLLLVVAILMGATWFAAEQGLFPGRVPYPPTWPWLRKNVSITVRQLQGQCELVDAPARLITKTGTTVTWTIRAHEKECSNHKLVLKFYGDDPTTGTTPTNVQDGATITTTIKKEGKDEALYFYSIGLQSDPRIIGYVTLAYCPEWPCKAAKAPAATAQLTPDLVAIPSPAPSPAPTIAPGTTIAPSPSPTSPPRPHP